MRVTTAGKSGTWRATVDKRREASRRRGCPAPGTRGRTSGLLLARARALGLAPPEPHRPGTPPPARKPGIIAARQMPYLAIGRKDAPARAAYLAAHGERLAAERDALFGEQAERLAAFEPASAD